MSEIASRTLLTCLRFTSPAASTTAFTRALLLIEPAFFASVFFPAMISPPGEPVAGQTTTTRRADPEQNRRSERENQALCSGARRRGALVRSLRCRRDARDRLVFSSVFGEASPSTRAR